MRMYVSSASRVGGGQWAERGCRRQLLTCRKPHTCLRELHNIHYTVLLLLAEKRKACSSHMGEGVGG